MKRSRFGVGVIGFSLVIGILLWSPLLLAGQLKGSQFLGIWEGVDEEDGSLIEVQISPGKEKDFKILWYETYWTSCKGGRGILKGTGSLKPSDGPVIVFDAYIFCFESGTTPWEGTITFTRVNNALLLATAFDHQGNEAFANSPVYRISNPVRPGFPFIFGQY